MTRAVRMTGAGHAVAVTIVVFCLAAMVLREITFVVAAVPLLVALVLEITTAVIRPVEVGVSMASPRILTGDTVDLVLNLWSSISTRRHLDIVTVGHLSQVQVGGHDLQIPRGDSSATVALQGVGWGLGSVRGLTLTWQGFFGLLQSRTRHPLTIAPIRVLPTPEELRALARPRRTVGWSGTRTAQIASQGIEFADIRPFQQGDRARDLHGPTTARRGQPWVTTRHPERSIDVVLALDLFDPAQLAEVVRVAVTLTHAYLDTRDQVGIVGLGGVLTWVSPAAGERHRVTLVDQILASQFVATWVTRRADHLPSRALPAGALVIGVTRLGDRMLTLGADLRARGHDLVLLDLETTRDPAADPVEKLAVRLLALQQEQRRREMRRLGVAVVPVAEGASVAAALGEVQTARRLVGSR